MVHELEKIKIGKAIDNDMMDLIVGGTSNIIQSGSNSPSADCNTYTCNFKFCDYTTCSYDMCDNYNMCDYKVCDYEVCLHVVN